MTPIALHVTPLLIQGGGGTRRGGAADLLLIVQNEHASGVAHKILEDGIMRQKHLDAVA